MNTHFLPTKSADSLDSSHLQVTLKEKEANLSSVSPTADPVLPVSVEPDGLFEVEAPNPLYGEGQNMPGGNGAVHYESVDMTEAENPMY